MLVTVSVFTNKSYVSLHICHCFNKGKPERQARVFCQPQAWMSAEDCIGKGNQHKIFARLNMKIINKTSVLEWAWPRLTTTATGAVGQDGAGGNGATVG